MPRVKVQDIPYSLSFIGGNTIDRSINLTTPIAIGAASDFTVSGWVYYRPKTATGNLDSHTLFAANFNYAGNLGYLFQVTGNTGGVGIYAGSSDSTYFSTAGKFEYNRWNYLLYELSGTTLNVYVNNMVTPVYTVTITRKADNTLSSRIGSESTGTGNARRIDGYLSSVYATNRILSTSEKVALSNGALPSGTSIYYKLTEGSGTTATDSSGNGNNGTIINGTWSTDTPSKLRTASSNRVAVQDIKSSLSFNGTSSQVSTNPINLGTSVSFGVKFKTYKSSQQNLMAYMRTLVRITPSLNRIIWYPDTDLGSNNIAVANFSLGQWHSFVITQTGTSYVAYFDGVAVASGTTAVNAQVAMATTGLLGAFAGTRDFLGNMVAYFTIGRVITPTEVSAYHISGAIPTGSSLIQTLQEGAGTTAYDLSGNGTNGTITSGTYTSDTPVKKRKTVNDNLVYNGDFEYAPPFTAATTTMSRWIDGTAAGSTTNTNFGAYVIGSSGVSAEFDPINKASGANSIKIVIPASKWIEVHVGRTGYGTTQNYHPVLPSTSYTLTAKMKTTFDGDSDGGARMLIYKATGSFTDDGSVGTNLVKITTDWTTYTRTFTTGANTRYVRVLCSVSTDTGAATLNGTAWFDDIQLRPTTPTTRTAA